MCGCEETNVTWTLLSPAASVLQEHPFFAAPLGIALMYNTVIADQWKHKVHQPLTTFYLGC